ncbi:TatD family hydrolase [Paenibacillus sp. J2TS4]|uniref:TatD family hydrolase n=1 Tax=Paenibacillus sp. J2TS4 TaxID=2807194 RepID=UPI001B2E9247|nr:TatD family hydrolase [Paenibacillus sp. J2TS4]GIP35769.1 hypothetical protein J2TS4_49790 [Paenibacillus sp. J2TS4]
MDKASYIDAHIHLDQYSDDELAGMLREMPENGIEGLVAVSTDGPSCRRTQVLHADYPRLIRPAYGFHPEQPLLPEEEQDALLSWMKEQKGTMAAIGEVGLPYYTRRAKWAQENEGGLDLQPYVEWLESCLRLAAEVNKPVVLHAVYEDAEMVCDLLEKHNVAKAHFHWFKGSDKTTERMIRNGYYVSVTPDIVYEEEIWRLAARYPLEQMMVETDGPWPFEGPFQGKRTHPWMLAAVVDKLARLKRVDSRECAQLVLENTRSFYG